MNKAVEATILVVDDKVGVRELLHDYLSAQGFRVVTAVDGRDGLLVARDEEPDLVLLDIMMPNMGGYEFLKLYREEFTTPVILLTARLEESDKVLGLELGADDYVTKPFGMRELVARVRAVLRRVERSAPPEVLSAAGIGLDRERRLVTADGKPVRLTPTEFELLATLMSSPGRVYPRAELLERIRGFEGESSDRTVDVHIRNLRTKVEVDPGNPTRVETVFGVGYRFRPASGEG